MIRICNHIAEGQPPAQLGHLHEAPTQPGRPLRWAGCDSGNHSLSHFCDVEITTLPQDVQRILGALAPGDRLYHDGGGWVCDVPDPAPRRPAGRALSLLGRGAAAALRAGDRLRPVLYALTERSGSFVRAAWLGELQTMLRGMSVDMPPEIAALVRARADLLSAELRIAARKRLSAVLDR